jgi:hypothetical protein
LSVLIVSTTACAGSPRVEYVRLSQDIPAFPAFPSPDCVVLDEAAETVSMPLWYWQKVAEYKIGVDAVEEYLKKANGEVTNDNNSLYFRRNHRHTEPQ